MTILIVEDNEITAKLLELSLRKWRYKAITASKVPEALAFLESDPAIELVITDIILPGVNGLELLRRMKDDPKWKDIPVIMCTALADAENVKAASALGCRHYLVKPLQPSLLFERVEDALKDKKPILQDKVDVMSKLGLDFDSYKQLARTFGRLLNHQLDQLGWPKVGPAKHEEPISWSEISEAAAILGADRLRGALENWLDGDGTTVSEAVLARECKLVLEELDPLLRTPAHSRNETPA